MSGDLLSALMNAVGSQSGSSQSGGDPLSALLGGLMGGGGAQSAQGGDVLGSLLGGLLGGGSGAQGAQQGAGNQGSLMGGGGAQGAQGSDVLGSLLGGLLGGGASQGGQQTPAAPTAPTGIISSHPYLAPIVDGLAQKLGLPPAIAEVVVSFALSQLLNGVMSRASTGGAPGTPTAAGSQRAFEGARNLQMEDIAQRFQNGQAIDTQYLHSAGLARQLADQTGLDPKTAAASLEHAFQLLGTAPASDSEQAVREKPPQEQQKVSRGRKK